MQLATIFACTFLHIWSFMTLHERLWTSTCWMHFSLKSFVNLPCTGSKNLPLRIYQTPIKVNIPCTVSRIIIFFSGEFSQGQQLFPLQLIILFPYQLKMDKAKLCMEIRQLFLLWKEKGFSSGEFWVAATGFTPEKYSSSDEDDNDCPIPKFYTTSEGKKKVYDETDSWSYLIIVVLRIDEKGIT